MATAVQVESLWNGLTDNNGQPLAAGKVFTYAAGTTNPVSLFTASDKSTSATNPLILDANGKAQVWADGRYKFVIKTAADVTLYTLDNLLYGFDDTTVLYGGVSTGAANAQVVSVPATVTSYANGQTVSFVAGFTNTGATTLQFNSLSATNLVKGPTPSSLQAGDLIAGQLYTATYHGGTFRLQDYPSVADIQRSRYLLATGVSGTNTITANLTPAPSSYETGMVVQFVVANTNTGATTLNLNSLGAKTVQKQGAALTGGEFVAGQSVQLFYDGTNFQALSSNVGVGTVAAPSYSFGSDSDTGMYYPAANEIGFATGGIIRANIDSGGNVGVGTGGDATPEGVAGAGSKQLTVKATNGYAQMNVFTRSATSDGSYINLCKSRGSTAGNFTIITAGDTVGGINFSGATGTEFRACAAVSGVSDATPSASSMPGRLIFSTTPTGSLSPAERMRIDSSGSVGIGSVSDATVRLTVYGIDTGSSNWSFAARSSTTYLFGVRNDGRVGIGTSTPGYQLALSTDSAAKPTTNTWTIASDERLKTNVQPYAKGLAEICQVNPITYDYNGKGGIPAGPGGVSILAQELQPVFPECVGSYKGKLDEGDEEDTEILNYNGHAITFALINAVKELNTKIESLEARLAVLEAV